MKKTTAVMTQIVMDETPMIAGATKVSSTSMLHMVKRMLFIRLTLFVCSIVYLPKMVVIRSGRRPDRRAATPPAAA